MFTTSAFIFCNVLGMGLFSFIGKAVKSCFKTVGNVVSKATKAVANFVEKHSKTILAGLAIVAGAALCLCTGGLAAPIIGAGFICGGITAGAVSFNASVFEISGC